MAEITYSSNGGNRIHNQNKKTAPGGLLICRVSHVTVFVCSHEPWVIV